MIELNINGITATFEEGTKLLECCREMGLQIPTLCSHKALSPYGACRLCLVEVEQNGKSTLQASCTFPALPGIKVKTDTPRVQKTRKIMAELLLARAPEAEAVKKIAADFGVTEPRISKKYDDCIYCGLCVRMCEERMGRYAIGLSGRGPNKKVEPPFSKDNPLCWICQACEFVCPTGKAIASFSREKHAPNPIPDEFNMGFNSRPSIFQLYPQMIPNAPQIDPNTCVHLNHDACGICSELCQAGAIHYDDQDGETEIKVGAVIVAPGYEIYDARLSGEYGYKRYPNVVTSLEFERILSASGPFSGHILRPSDQSIPHRVAFIQCVGSRNTDHMYCSSICCMYATKEAVIAREHNPDIQCTIFYRDMRAFGKGYEEYYERAKKEGIRYIKSSPSTVKQEPGSLNLTINYTANGSDIVEEEFDLVVLCVGVNAGPSKMLGELLQMQMNEDGFIYTDPFRPVETDIPGVFVAGASTGPKDIPESVMEADAAVSRCLGLLGEVAGQQISQKEYPPEKDVSKEEPRVGVFVCHCGSNIAGVVNVPEVVDYARMLPNVVYAENNLYTCSADTCERIKNKIIEENLNRLVVASCTPRTHEPIFMDTMKSAGLNPYLFEMANIRDQCSWVHMHQPAEATRKAKDLVRMAVAKVRMNESLYPQYVEVRRKALVIGGGIAGMTAALELSSRNIPVHLVEKEAELGGFAKKLTRSSDGDIRKKLADTIDAVNSDPNITVHLSSNLKQVEGSVPRFTSTIANGSEETKVEHGIIIVATGAREHQPQSFHYGESPKVKTQTELEAELNEKSFSAQSVVMVQCVGSREEPNDYCSRVCCNKAVTNALAIKEISPETEIYILHKDIRTYAFYERDYRRARELGVHFIRFEDEKPTVTPNNGHLDVKVQDSLLNRFIDLKADLVVLSTAIESLPENEEVGKLLKVPLNKHGFFLEAHMKLRPVDFSTDGIFVCGTAHSPKTFGESIVQAMAAAARAGVILSKEKMEIEPRISEPIDANCDGCAYCVDPCPYSAINLIEYMRNGVVKKTVDVDITLCHGCGTCMATCPKQGIYVRNFRLEQFDAVIEAALEPVA